MLFSFRVSELQMLLGYAGRNKTGRKTELQQRALELLRVRSQSVHQKIRDLHKTIQQNGSLLPIQSTSPPTTPTGNVSPNMPQHPANIPRAAVNPFNMDTRAHVTRQTRSAAAAAVAAATYSQHQNMYQQSYHNTQQYQAAPRGIAPTNIVNNYPVHPDVEFKRLPFFDVVAELIKPSTLMPMTSTRVQECNFYFHLTPQQATDIAQSRDVRHNSRGEYFKQIQMRFCLMETSCKQEDFFPPGIVVKVNNKQCPLPNPVPTNKPGVEPKRPPRPVNITQYIKLSPTSANTINVQWMHDYGRVYAITVALVHKQASSDLLQRLKTRGVKHADITRGLIQEKLNEDADNEIATTSLRVSLMCPLGKMRMTNPCRAKTCNHLQCFDASLYLQMNERKPTWTCPVCDKPALYEDLDVDGYFQLVLNSPEVSSDIKEIQLHKDGSWSVQNEVKPAPVAKPVQKSASLDDSIEIIDDDYLPSSNATSSSELTKLEAKEELKDQEATTPIMEKSVVDLTISDSDDDEPLAKRRAIMTKPDSTNKFSDTTSISSSSNQSRVSVTPGPSSVSSSGYPISPSGVIALDSPSPPPSSPQNLATTQSQPASCMMANGSSAAAQSPMFSPTMPYLNAEGDGSSAQNINNYY